MNKIAKQLTELVGNTPLLELNSYSKSKGIETPVIAKIEYFNPGGSVKDRIALAMIEDAERKGVLKPGATIIEPTSGNTGERYLSTILYDYENYPLYRTYERSGR